MKRKVSKKLVSLVRSFSKSRIRILWEFLPRWRRRRAYERNVFPWHIGLIRETLEIKGKKLPHPALKSAVFVVHGIGRQEFTETAALLRSGFDDALSRIEKWQIWHDKRTISDDDYVPPPYTYEGYWANYPDIAATFKSDWDLFEHDEEAQDFFENLWKRRVKSTGRTYRWFLWQQLRLLNPLVIFEVGLLAWLMYWPFQITSFVTLTLAMLIRREIVSDFLADVRLYVDPQGVTERAIVQQIDYRVGKRFLRMLGLNWEFRPLPIESKIPDEQRLSFRDKPLEFDRIVWVGHSLGTVISYNVLSDLFQRAKEIESRQGSAIDREQLDGVRKFRSTLRRFVTLGSPLDKVAYLFRQKAITPWPDGERRKLLDAGADGSKDWWVNYYHQLDPVSGSLESEFICGNIPPINEHIGIFHLPGWAHMAYWSDPKPLRFILSRTYGKEILEDKTPRRIPVFVLSALALFLTFLQLIIPIAMVITILDYLGVVSWREVWNLIVSYVVS